MLRDSFRRKRTTKLFPLFVLLIESGTLYVVMLVSNTITIRIVSLPKYSHETVQL